MGKKGENTKANIKRIAKRLFLEKGYKDVSMQDICNSTGLSKGGLYRYYGNKAEILLELVNEEKNIHVDEDIKNGLSASCVLENLLNEYRNNMKNCQESLALALYEYATCNHDNNLANKHEKDRKIWRELVDYGMKTGEFRNIDPDIIMDTFLYAYRGIRLWGRILDFDDKTYEHITDSVKLLLLKDYKGGTINE